MDRHSLHQRGALPTPADIAAFLQAAAANAAHSNGAQPPSHANAPPWLPGPPPQAPAPTARGRPSPATAANSCPIGTKRKTDATLPPWGPLAAGASASDGGAKRAKSGAAPPPSDEEVMANPKGFLSAHPAFVSHGKLPFVTTEVPVPGGGVHFIASIKVPLPGGSQAVVGRSQPSKKVAEQSAAIEALRRLGVIKGSAAQPGQTPGHAGMMSAHDVTISRLRDNEPSAALSSSSSGPAGSSGGRYASVGSPMATQGADVSRGVPFGSGTGYGGEPYQSRTGSVSNPSPADNVYAGNAYVDQRSSRGAPYGTGVSSSMNASSSALVSGGPMSRGAGASESPAEIWGDNPKNELIASKLYAHMVPPSGKPALPLSVQPGGKPFGFRATMPVPLGGGRPDGLAVGHGSNKAAAERACVLDALNQLHAAGRIHPPGQRGTGSGAWGGSGVGMEDIGSGLPCIEIEERHQAALEEALRGLWDSGGEAAAVGRWALAAAQPWLAGGSGLAPQATPGVPPSAPTSTVPQIMVPAQEAALNAELRATMERRVMDPRLVARMAARAKLPVAAFRGEILEAVRGHGAVLIVGETGCGKTTQVPQLLLEEAEARGTGAGVRIIVTQPRKVAAVTVAERVAWERGEELGDAVGYSIKLDNRRPRRAGGTITFVTTGGERVVVGVWDRWGKGWAVEAVVGSLVAAGLKSVVVTVV
eukprot:jgi/Mesvir1/13632/Mv01995-RA.1